MGDKSLAVRWQKMWLHMGKGMQFTALLRVAVPLDPCWAGRLDPHGVTTLLCSHKSLLVLLLQVPGSSLVEQWH